MDRYEALLEKFQAGDESAAEAEELSRLVRGDAERGASFYDAMMLEADLYETYAGIAQVQVAPRPRRRRFTRTAMAAWAAAVLFLVVLAILLRSGRPPAEKVRETVPIAPRPPEPKPAEPVVPDNPPPQKTPRYRYPPLEREDDEDHGSEKDELEREYQKGLREVERKRREGKPEEAEKKLREIERERQKHLREQERRGGDR